MKLPNRNLIILLAAVILLVLAWFALVNLRSLNGPESIAWDEIGKRFLVSNVKGGSIVSMDVNGKFSPFLKKGLSAPKGIIAKANKLYVADQTELKIIQLDKATVSQVIPITGAVMLNDIALDKSGLVYITDTSANCVFIVNPDTKTVDKVVSPLLKAPNGIVYDMPRNQMFIVGFSNQASILALSTVDRSVTTFMDSIYSNLDGIAIDDLGRIYFSTWEQDMIVEVPQEQNRFVAKYKDIKDAADMLYYLPNNELIIPLFSQNKVIRIPLD